jgi:hypothetical protein
MGKIQFPNLRALPAGPRWLAYGVLLLCAILVGGVITAYGGMLLVVLMWAVCMGGLCLLLHFTWQTVFPGQRVAHSCAVGWLAPLWALRSSLHWCATAKRCTVMTRSTILPSRHCCSAALVKADFTAFMCCWKAC